MTRSSCHHGTDAGQDRWCKCGGPNYPVNSADPRQRKSVELRLDPPQPCTAEGQARLGFAFNLLIYQPPRRLR
jgi:hypothetical protein